MGQLIGVVDAARELDLHPSRVRALILDGALHADKVAGRWLVDWDSVVARRREAIPAGRPLAAHNAWALLLLASGEPVPKRLDAVARWRLRQALAQQGLVATRGRLERRASVHRLWALPGELRALRAVDEVVLTGSSAAGSLGLGLAAPDEVDLYVAASRLDELVSEHRLQEAPAAEINVTLRAVPANAWTPGDRRTAPKAAVAVDLASYRDSRSARVGMQLLQKLDHGSGPIGAVA